MERFFDGTDQENSKTQGGKGQIRLIQKKQEGKNGEKKKKILFCNVCGSSHTRVFFPSVGNALV